MVYFPDRASEAKAESEAMRSISTSVRAALGTVAEKSQETVLLYALADALPSALYTRIFSSTTGRQSPEQSAAPIRKRRESVKSKAILTFLADRSPRLISEISITLYGDDSRPNRQKTQSLLNYLRGQQLVEQVLRGQWRVVGDAASVGQPADHATEKADDTSVHHRVIEALRHSTEPLLTSEILVEVRNQPGARATNPQTINAAISSLHRDGIITRDGPRQGEYRYSLAGIADTNKKIEGGETVDEKR